MIAAAAPGLDGTIIRTHGGKKVAAHGCRSQPGRDFSLELAEQKGDRLAFLSVAYKER